jgi:hypothetical protein
MKQGLYDIEIRPGSFRELALLFREMRDREVQYRDSLLSMGEALKNPDEILDSIRKNILPGTAQQKKKTMEEKAQYLRSLKDVDWSEVLSFDPEEMDRIENRQKAEDELGPLASS